MNIGFIGLGKLGKPVARAIETKGHTVYGYDVKDTVIENEEGYSEPNIVRCDNIKEVIEKADIVFVAVQTPHDPKHEGTEWITTVADFNYAYLINVLNEINKHTNKETHFALISTVAPNTYDRLKEYITNPLVKYCYNPYFIAMGTVIPDFLNPEFVLIGGECGPLEKFYKTIHNKPIIKMSIVSAEITKMAYNTFIGMKIVFANNLMELSHLFGGQVDDITGALCKATDRIISTKYLHAGMGDGGGCHPRDNIVMSHIAKTNSMSNDLAGMVMKTREAQAEWIADLCMDEGLPVCVLGLEFKPETNIKTGSSAVLLLNILKEKGAEIVEDGAACYVIGCKHKRFKDYKFPHGSVVIDPHRYIPDQEGVTVKRIGE